MSNKASNQLFLLIKSLSKQEKRYFKIFSNRHSSENNSYFKLYQIILAQNEYDETEVIKKLKDQHAVNRLSIAKTRLYDQLLKSLNAYHASKTVDSELFFILQSVEVLYQKALYRAAWKKLERGIKMAGQNEKHELLLQFYKWKHKLLEKDNYEKFTADKIDLLFQEENKVVEQIKTYQKLWHIKSKIFKLLFYDGNNSGNDQKLISLSFKKRLESVNKDTLCVRSEFLLHHIYSAFYYAGRMLDKSYMHLKENLRLMEDAPQMFVDNPYSRVSVLSNMSFIAFKLKKQTELSALLVKLRNLKEVSEEYDVTLQIRWFYSYYSIFLAMKASQSQVEIDENEISEIYRGLEKYKDKLPTFRRLDLQFAVSVYFFKAGDTRKALRGIHAILNELNSKTNPAMFYAARFFYLILLLEMDKIDYLNVAWISTKRSLLSRKSIDPEALVFKSFFNRVCKSGQPELFMLLDDLISDLSGIKPSIYIEFFDFKAWAIDKKESFNTSGAIAS